MQPIRPKEEPLVPPWIKNMVRSKYFWITLAIVIPFIVVWVKYGFFWAIGMLIALGIMFLIIFTNRRRRIRRYYYDDEEDYDEEEIVMERRRRSPSSSNRMRDLYIPKVDKNFYVPRVGKDFYVPRDLGKRQETDLKRTLRRLRGGK